MAIWCSLPFEEHRVKAENGHSDPLWRELPGIEHGCRTTSADPPSALERKAMAHCVRLINRRGIG